MFSKTVKTSNFWFSCAIYTFPMFVSCLGKHIFAVSHWRLCWVSASSKQKLSDTNVSKIAKIESESLTFQIWNKQEKLNFRSEIRFEIAHRWSPVCTNVHLYQNKKSVHFVPKLFNSISDWSNCDPTNYYISFSTIQTEKH